MNYSRGIREHPRPHLKVRGYLSPLINSSQFTIILNTLEGNMAFGLSRTSLGENVFQEITPEQAGNICRLRNRLLEIHFWEEKFDFLLANYYEFEAELLASAAKYMVYRRNDSIWLANQRRLIHRRTANLLSTGRLYIDHSKHHLSSAFGKDSHEYGAFVKGTKFEYDTRLGYRAMEALRNYAQHRGFPFHSISYLGEWVGEDPDKNLMFSCAPYLEPENYVKEKKFKKEVAKELEEIGEKVDLRWLARDYLEGLCNIHQQTRDNIQASVEKWDSALENVITSYCELGGVEDISISISVVEGTEFKYKELCSIFKDVIDRRKYLQEVNSGLDNLSRRYTSGEINQGQIRRHL